KLHMHCTGDGLQRRADSIALLSSHVDGAVMGAHLSPLRRNARGPHHRFACCATFIGNPNRSINPRAAVTSNPSMLKLASLLSYKLCGLVAPIAIARPLNSRTFAAPVTAPFV